MATPALDPKICREAYDLWLRFGKNDSTAANYAGVSRSTFRDRRKRDPRHLIEQRQNSEIAAADYTAPAIPDPEEPLEDTIERIIAERRRQKDYRAATDWMEFKVNDNKPFALVFVGDPHIDTCDMEILKRDLDIIQNTDRMWAVGLGDWCNGWVRRLRDQYSFQTTTEKQGYRLVQWMLDMPIWWLIILGNHNGQRWHGAGSPLNWMRSAAAVEEPLQWQAKFKVACGDHTWKIWAAHDFPGHSQYAEDFGPNKRAILHGGAADLYIAGDHHTFTLRQTQHSVTGNLYWSARARGYKPLDHYAEELGYLEQFYGNSIVAVCDPRDGTMQCFGDVNQGRKYLEYVCANLD